MRRNLIIALLAGVSLQSCHLDSLKSNSEGLTLMRQRDFVEASALFGTICQEDPTWMPAFYNRGVALANSGQYEKALSDFNLVLEYYPNHADTYFNRAILYENMGENSLAIKDYSEAIALQPQFLMAYHYRGIVRFNTEDLQGALEDFTKAINIGRGVSMEVREAKEFGLNSSGLFFCRGAVYQKMGEYEKAVEDYTQSITINPANAKAYFNRGAAYLKLGEEEKASADLQHAAELAKQ